MEPSQALKDADAALQDSMEAFAKEVIGMRQIRPGNVFAARAKYKTFIPVLREQRKCLIDWFRAADAPELDQDVEAYEQGERAMNSANKASYGKALDRYIEETEALAKKMFEMRASIFPE